MISLKRRWWWLLFVALLVALQCTRHENQLTITYDGTSLSASAHGDVLILPLSLGSVRQVSVSLQKSMIGENSVAAFSILDSSGRALYDFSKPVFYLLGRNILDVSKRGTYPDFKRTFGDWTMDRFRSSKLVIYDRPLPETFSIKVHYLGRGNTSLYLSGTKQRATVNLRDGFIDNDFSICTEEACPRSRSSTEAGLENAKRLCHFFLEALLLGTVLVLLASFLGEHEATNSEIEQNGNRAPGAKSFYLYLALTLSVLHFVTAAYFSVKVLGGIPHIPDGATYYRQAILLSQGQLEIKDFPFDPIEAFVPNAAYVRGRTITFFHNNHFWPGMLAGALLLRIPTLLNPLLSAFSVILVYLIGFHLYNRRIGLISCLLFALCPFSLILSGSFMTHSASLFFCLGAIYSSLRYVEDGKVGWAGLAGVCAASAFGLRQLTSVALALPFLVYLLTVWRKQVFRKQTLGLVILSLPVLYLFLLNSKEITGSFFSLPLLYLYPHSFSLSNIPAAINLGDAMLGYLQSIIAFRPVPLLLFGLSALPFLLQPRKEDFLCLSFFVSLLSLHFLSNANGLHGYGPRFIYEGLFGLFLLSARGVTLLFSHRGFLLRVTLTLLFSLSLVWSVLGLSSVLPQYRNYNGISVDLFEKLSALDLPNSVVIVSSPNWQGLDIAATLFDPEFRSSVFIKKLPDRKHFQVLSQFPGRLAYLVYGDKIIELGKNKDDPYHSDPVLD